MPKKHDAKYYRDRQAVLGEQAEAKRLAEGKQEQGAREDGVQLDSEARPSTSHASNIVKQHEPMDVDVRPDIVPCVPIKGLLERKDNSPIVLKDDTEIEEIPDIELPQFEFIAIDKFQIQVKSEIEPNFEVTDSQADAHSVDKPEFECDSPSISPENKPLCDIVVKGEPPTEVNATEELDIDDSGFSCKLCLQGFMSDIHLEQHKTHCVKVLVTASAETESDAKKNEDVQTPTDSDPSKTTLNASHKKTTGTANKRFNCNVCGKVFKFSCLLARHARTHAEGRPFGCVVCGATFRLRCNLNEHARTHTEERPFGCDVCGSRFRDNSALKVHKRIHSGDRPFVCTACGAKFACSGTLISHKRTHSGDKPYSCDLCEARFSQMSQLTIHMRRHTGERPYGCDKCDAKFKECGTLASHMRTHTGERPYGCSLCDAKFKQNGDLGRHMRTHTGGPSFSCDKCDGKFTRRSNLTKHMNTHKLDV